MHRDSSLSTQRLLVYKQETIALKNSIERPAMWLLWILSLAAASFLLPATGEVLDSFSPCKKFFLDGNPPKLRPRHSARICQLHEDDYRFATMYDKDRRIPTFSAYIYDPGQGQRWNQWKIEPQLALRKDREYRRHKSMQLEENNGIDHQRLANSQAVEEDYHNVERYDRGHLAPALHQPDQASKDATFTLTNIAERFQLKANQPSTRPTSCCRNRAER
ncbi:endonuclease domain-containing 1 protein-like [Crotalus adamanteus]|uniref:Endonuclease domain-containing 1 protein-like n=1 Tax=Crotalus adamanteus TaxID=8729 RepID=A0AAW1BDI6_CROAD